MNVYRHIKYRQKIRSSIILVLLFVFPILSFGQINAYAKVTAITGSVLSLSNVNQTFGTFSAGQYIIVIQMQGADITGNTANNASFGTLNSLNSAGLYEVAQIVAVNGGVTSMSITGSLANSYQTAGSIQIVSYPKLGVTNFNTTANITGLSWDGNIGGVIAFYVSGNLNLFHNISANAIGFRGGAKAGQDGGGCETNVFRIATGDPKYADKGEGIYITTNGQKSARGKAVNGGGGGIVHNGGGGGGGNFTSGGNGYYGFTGGGYCSAAVDAGGQGGEAVASTASRVFMGGGGGGGQENNGVGSNGGNGGGIILLKCDTIVVSGACSAVSISANGATAASGGNDGMGGGGAAGSMVLRVKGIRAIGACPLTISGNGGAGGSVGNGTSHGAGGGGGQGALYISASGTFSNTTITTNNGAGGNANSGGSPPTGGSGGGVSGSGVITGTNTSPLPIELKEFRAIELTSKLVDIQWQTASEINNARFELYHSSDANTWKLIGSLDGKGNSSNLVYYNLKHHDPIVGVNYYRLQQIDFDGQPKFSPIIHLLLENEKYKVSIYPNPGEGLFFIESEIDLNEESIYILNASGEKINVPVEKRSAANYLIDLKGQPIGLYFLKSQHISEKIILK